MSTETYLLDTHALLFWAMRVEMPESLIAALDEYQTQGRLFASAANFWEIALLVQKGRIELTDVKQWKDELLAHTSLQLLMPDADNMIASVQLPPHHKDPFDRLIIAQAFAHKCVLVSKDGLFKAYGVPLLWL